jgi:hypothetical protein
MGFLNSFSYYRSEIMRLSNISNDMNDKSLIMAI